MGRAIYMVVALQSSLVVTHPNYHFDPCCLLSINLTPLVNHLLCGFWALKKRKKKKRFALGLGINKQQLNMLCGIFRKSTSWLSFLIKQCCNLFMSYYYLVSFHRLLDPKASKMMLDHCWFNALKSTYGQFFCRANL